ncbi:unnamed protein product [Paramecium sonneborni]|uniref:Uncharacterized protein n=1 Tax=Paramecium sonneborni TaxID=65129 RepID=A0A8S1RLQ7_9CILI|nr:unnamed protein product [Paramecium sonneborni]
MNKILYFQKILYDHVNSLASIKIELIDFYYQDPTYKTIISYPIQALQFDLEYYQPTQLEESNEYLCQNQVQKTTLDREIETKRKLQQFMIIRHQEIYQIYRINTFPHLLRLQNIEFLSKQDSFQSQNKPEIPLSNYIQNLFQNLQNFLQINELNQNVIKDFQFVDLHKMLP